MSTDPKITAQGIWKVFGNDAGAAIRMARDGGSAADIFQQTGQTVAVRDATFDVSDGEIFVVMGLSGSGKSTLVRMINRLIDPTEGTMQVNGRDITAMSNEELTDLRRSEMGMVFQHFALFPHKTVGENVAFGLKIQGAERGARFEKSREALEQVGLGPYADAFPDELSGGMQQRVGLARALATGSNLLLMDEPFSALDPLIRRDMQRQLLELESDSRRTIVFITHDLHEALILGDRIAIMRGGAINQIGTGEEIVASPADDYVAAFTQDIDRSRVFTVGTIMHEADGIRRDEADLDTVHQRLRARRARGIYVIGEDGKPTGLIAQRDLDRRRSGAGIDALLRDRYATCTADDTLNHLYDKCVSGLPIAVTDDGGRFLGSVDPLDIFAYVAESDGGQDRDAGSGTGRRSD